MYSRTCSTQLRISNLERDFAKRCRPEILNVEGNRHGLAGMGQSRAEVQRGGLEDQSVQISTMSPRPVRVVRMYISVVRVAVHRGNDCCGLEGDALSSRLGVGTHFQGVRKEGKVFERRRTVRELEKVDSRL